MKENMATFLKVIARNEFTPKDDLQGKYFIEAQKSTPFTFNCPLFCLLYYTHTQTHSHFHFTLINNSPALIHIHSHFSLVSDCAANSF